MSDSAGGGSSLSSQDLELGALLQLMDPHANPAELALTLGIRATQSGDARSALSWLDFAVRMNPSHAPTRLNRAVAHYMRKAFDDALADLDRAIELQPDYVMAWRNRATLHSERHDHSRAIADLSQAIELTTDPANRYVCFLDRSVSRYLTGDVPGAIADCMAAIELDPRSPDAYANRAGFRQAGGDAAGALDDATRVVELVPNSSDAWYNRGTIHESAGRLNDAESDYRRATELEPQLAIAQQALTRVRARRPGA